MAIISKRLKRRRLVRWSKLGLLLIASGACLLTSHACAAPSVESAWRSGEITFHAQSNSGENASTDSKGDGTADDGSKKSAEEKVVQGVNRAGTVRVNYLANIGDWLTLPGNLFCLGLMIWGVLIALKGKRELGSKLINCGGLLLIAGFFVGPGLVNWLIANAREVGLEFESLPFSSSTSSGDQAMKERSSRPRSISSSLSQGKVLTPQSNVDFNPYMANLQRRIWRAWFPPRGQESRRVQVIFKVHSQGELSDLHVEKSSGLAVVDQAALQAVQNAAPFPPLPAGASIVVEIQFNFDYNLFSGQRSF